jgi:hypothetical protein
MAIALMRVTIIPAIATACTDMSERAPPRAGPIKNPKPNAAPMSQSLRARSAGAEISEIYAWITPNPAPPNPEISRAIKNQINVGLSISIAYPIVFASEVRISIGLRPNRSDNGPNINPPAKVPSE